MPSTYKVDETDGAAGVRVALEKAEAGDTVAIGAGRFELDGPLTVPPGVTLKGAGQDKTEFGHDYDGPAIQAFDADDVTLSDFAVTSTITEVRLRALPDDPPAGDGEARENLIAEWGLVWINGGKAAKLERLVARSENSSKIRVLTCRGTAATRISECSVVGFHGSGISLISSTDGEIFGNRVVSSGNGICLLPSRTLGLASSAAIMRNLCHKNSQSGIVLFSSGSERISENECNENGQSGIGLTRDTGSLNAPSTAVITGNRCHGNADAGIVLLSSSSRNIAENDCRGNGKGGIVLKRDADGTNAPSSGVITGNVCYENNRDGIELVSSEVKEISRNECCRNSDSGIVLNRNTDCPDVPSSGSIIGNNCHENGQCGIVLSSSSSDSVFENECSRNALNGINVGRDPDSPYAPSIAVIVGNRCLRNTQTGIILFSSISERIFENECKANGGSGIVLTRDGVSRDFPSNGVVTRNRCSQNSQVGIALLSSNSDCVSENECRGNGLSGIVLRRDQDSPQAPSSARVTRNHCLENYEDGIVLLSSESDQISLNHCASNGSNGIVLTRDESSPDAPSFATITQNCCLQNMASGIVLFSSVSDRITENDCWQNNLNGISLVGEPESSGGVSSAVITQNRCHENHQHGISLVCSNSRSIGENDCWGNGGSGVGVPLVAGTQVLPSDAVIDRNRLFSNGAMGASLASSICTLLNNKLFFNASAGLRISHEEQSDIHPSEVTIHENQFAYNHWPMCIAQGSVWEAEGNSAWGNPEPASLMEPAGRILAPLEVDFETRSLSEAETRVIARKGAFWEELAERLAEDPARDDPDALARYLLGHGALGDLKRFLDRGEPLLATDEEIEGADVEGAGQTSWRLDPEEAAEGSGRYVFSAVPGGGLAKRVWSAVGDLVDRGQTGTTVIAACGDLASEVDALAENARRLKDYVAYSEPAPSAPTGPGGLADAFAHGGYRLSEPLVFEYADRNLSALEGGDADAPFLEPEPVSGWKGWLQRLWHIATTPALALRGAGLALALPVLAWIVGWSKGFEAPLTDPLGAMLHAIRLNIEDLQLFDWITILFPVALVVGILVKVRKLLNTHLPHHLAWSFGDKAESVRDRGAPWSRWLKRRLFGRADVALVILRDMQEWTKNDISALNDLVALRPKDKSLVIVLETASRAHLDRVLLRPLYHDEPPLSGRVDAFAVIGEEPESLTLPPAETRETAASILGLAPGENTAEAEGHLAGIHDVPFSADDIIPLLVLGSNPFQVMAMSRPAHTSFSRFGPEVSGWLNRFGRIYAGDPAFEHDWSGEADKLNRLIDTADRATSIHLTRTRKERERRYRLSGRYRKRTDMVAVLKEIFGTGAGDFDDGLRDYLEALLSCGMVEAYETARKALMATPVQPERALAGLRAALALQGDIKAVVPWETPASAARRQMVGEARDAFIESIAATAVAGEETGRKRHALARLYGLSLQLDEKAGLPDLDGETPPGAAGCFVAEVRQVLRVFETHDRDLALALSRGRLRPLASALPERLRKALDEDLQLRRRRGKSLLVLLDEVATAEEAQALFERHRGISGDAACTLMRILAIAAQTTEQHLELARFVDAQTEPLAKLLKGASARGYVPEPKQAFSFLLGIAGALLDSLSAAGETETETYTEIDIMYGSTDSLFGHQGELEEMVFEKSDTIEPVSIGVGAGWMDVARS